MAIIEIQNLSAGYENGFVIRDISLSLDPGDFVAILGRNGSGKSTFIKAVQGLLRNVQGTVTIETVSLFRLSRRDVAKRIAYVPQLFEPVFEFTAGEIVAMGRYARQARLGALSGADALAVEEAMSMTEVLPLRDKKMAHLSGGERQRVFIARALAQDTPVLLLDEPSLHLDINYQVEIYGILKSLQKERGKTILAAEHNINLAAAGADRLIFLKDGAIQAWGTPKATITAETIRDIFDAEVEIRENRRSGLPEISLISGEQRS
jgi:iron complex transport system ATP-binding protein